MIVDSRATPDHVPDRNRLIRGPVNRKDLRRVERKAEDLFDSIVIPAASISGLRDVLALGGAQWATGQPSPSSGSNLKNDGQSELVFNATTYETTLANRRSAHGLVTIGKTAASTNSEAYVWQGTQLPYSMEMLPTFLLKFRSVNINAAHRFFAGLTIPASAGTELSADNSGVANLGLQYSTVRGDTKWQFIHSDGTTQTVVDTGVTFAVNTVLHFGIFVGSTSSVTFTLWDADGVVLKTSTFTTGLPGATVGIAPLAGVRTTANVLKDWGLYHWNFVWATRELA